MATKNVNNQELDCYTKIINLFLKIGKDPLASETWKDKSIVKIMNVLKDPKNKNRAKNALIILLSLFDDTPPDIYDNIGKNTETLSTKEKEQIIAKLKEEVQNKNQE